MSPSSEHAQVGMLYLSAAMRSTPMPKAKPRVALGVDADVAEHVRDRPCRSRGSRASRCPCRSGSPRRRRCRSSRRPRRDGSVNGKKCGRKRVVRSGPNIALHEVVERALEVAEGDALVDDESLDLRELGQVARVGDVAAVDLAGREHVDRRLLAPPSRAPAPGWCACAAARRSRPPPTACSPERSRT